MLAIDLTDKTALVTGAGQGIGRATAAMLVRAGANVVVNFFDEPSGINRQRAEQTVAELGPRAVAIGADVRVLSEVERMFSETVARFGRLDIVVGNAGILRDRTVKKMSSDEWQAVLDTNLTGMFNTCKAAGEYLADGGRIVNLASISGFLGFFGQANYAAAKAGVVALTKVLSRELARRAITVNAVAPGVVLTEMGESIPPASRSAMLAQIPLGRFAEPDEVASAILFLASPCASYITGQTLHVSGGWW